MALYSLSCDFDAIALSFHMTGRTLSFLEMLTIGSLRMASTRLLPLYDEFHGFLATPEEILAFKASPEAQAYAQELIERSSAGELTPEEEQTLKQMANFERMMSLLKAKALKISYQK